MFRSTDGGKTTTHVGSGTHGDHHDLWIDPDDPTHLVVGNDGGGAVSTNTGGRWTAQDFPTAQLYHVDHDEAHPVSRVRIAAGQLARSACRSTGIGGVRGGGGCRRWCGGGVVANAEAAAPAT